MTACPELLSPAGDAECLAFALQYGADAVYLGGHEYGMRSASANFSPEGLALAAQQVHAAGKRLYLTLNTLPTCAEMDEMPAFIAAAAAAGVDAFIITDLGVLALAKRHAPAVEVHISTQMGVMNHAAATALHQMGASRVVLARELGLEEIATIRAKTPPALRLEVFVHGSMCMSVSGRCLLSNYLAGRDANRGRCAQPCRWKYSLVEEQRPGQYFAVGEGEDGSYILTADDLCTVPFLDQIVAAGADSLKIEGRAKSFYYVASATAAYRAALDEVLAAAAAGRVYRAPAFATAEVNKISHRPYSPGFYLGPQGATQSVHCGGYIRHWQLLAVAQEQRHGRLLCRQRGKFSLGEALEWLLPGGKTIAFTPQAVWNEAGEPIKSTPHSQMLFWLPTPPDAVVPPGSILRKRVAESAFC